MHNSSIPTFPKTLMEWEYTFLQHIVVILVSHNIQCRELVASFPGSRSRKGEREPGNEARELEGSVMGKLLLCMHTVHDLHGCGCGKQQHGSGNHESHYLDLVRGPNGGSLGGLSCRRYRLSPHYRGGLENEAIPSPRGIRYGTPKEYLKHYTPSPNNTVLVSVSPTQIFPQYPITQAYQPPGHSIPNSHTSTLHINMQTGRGAHGSMCWSCALEAHHSCSSGGGLKCHN